PSLTKIEKSKRTNTQKRQDTPVTLIYATNPHSNDQRPTNSTRHIIKTYEANTRNTENYIYDRRLEPGMSYTIKLGNLVPLQSGSSSINIQTVFEETDPVYQSLLDRWLRLLDFPVPTYRRVAFDIELHSPIDTRVPDPQEA